MLEKEAQGLRNQVSSLTSALEEDRTTLVETQRTVQTLELKKEVCSVTSALEEQRNIITEGQDHMDVLEKETLQLLSAVTELSLRVAQQEQTIQEQMDMSTTQQQELQTAVAQAETLSGMLQVEEQRRTLLEQKIEELCIIQTSSQKISSTLRQESKFLKETMIMMEQWQQEKMLQKKNNRIGWFLCGSQGASSH
uniref:Uncharacterized protein n=1 Tax=Knipowitschia caucasica TaxID=637954 RepID=A0AAV2MJW5_KNICA